jgi:hypothetical protein
METIHQPRLQLFERRRVPQFRDSSRCACGENNSALCATHLSGFDAQHFRRCDLMPTLRAERRECRVHFFKIDLCPDGYSGILYRSELSGQPAFSECPLWRLELRLSLRPFIYLIAQLVQFFRPSLSTVYSVHWYPGFFLFEFSKTAVSVVEGSVSDLATGTGGAESGTKVELLLVCTSCALKS